jgi:hypothetical protein
VSATPDAASGGERAGCPRWCVVRHESEADALMHVGGALLVRHSLVRLCASTDERGAPQEGPFVLVGAEEFTLHEGEALLAALTQLLDEGQRSLAPQEPERALPVLDA